MANGINIATSENRGCGTFNFYMDKLFCGKVTISIQWDHREAMSQENSGSLVNRSWNVKNPSSKRNTHTAKQQDYPTQMHDGLRTGSITFRHHSSCEGKDQSSNSSRISEANNCNRLHSNRGRAEAEHHLNIQEGCPLARQKKISQALERNKAIQEEVEKLVDAGIMKEVHYHGW
ncbi:hypothetical protein Tco_0084251 [Tanacetum coccineum]